MHSRFIFLSLLHGAIANQDLPLFGTNNLFPPAPDMLPVTAVASHTVETRYSNGKLPSYRLIFNDGVLDSVPNNGFLKSGYVNLLPRARRGNALEIDAMGVVRIGKKLDLSAFADDAVSAPPETIGPDSRDPARDYYAHDFGANPRNDYPPFTSDNIFGPAAKGSTRPVTTSNQFRPPLAEHECLQESAPSLPIGFEARGEESFPIFGSPRTSDSPIVPSLPRSVIRGVSAEIARDEVYKLQRGDDGAMRSVLVLDANLGIHSALGKSIRSVEISDDGEVYMVDAAGPITGIEEEELLPTNHVSALDGFKPDAVGSLDSPNVLETSDGWRAESMGPFRPSELGGPHSHESGRSDSKKLIQPDLSLGVIGPTREGEDTPGPNAEARLGHNRASISSPLMVDENGRVYHQITQAHSEDGAHVINLPGLVLPTEIQSISTDEIGQLLAKDPGDGENECLLNMGGRTASGSALTPAGCTVQEGIDGDPHRRSPKRPIGGSDYLLPPVGGNPTRQVPDLVQAMSGNEEVTVGAGGGAGASGATNMTLLFNSMTVDKLAVLLPIVMFGTLLLVLVIFGITFCCLRQAEETYHINIRAIENKRHGNRDSRRRRKNNASTGAAEEGAITVQPRASGDQLEIESTKKGWFLQRWYNSLRGDAAPKTVSFSGAEIIPYRNPRSNLGWAEGIDGGRDTRDPSYVLEAVSDRLRQTQGRPRSLSTIRSDGGLGSSAAVGAVWATGRGRSEDASPGVAVVDRRMHGAKEDASTNFRQEFMSIIETTGLSGNPSSDFTLTHSPIKGFTDTSGPGGPEALASEDRDPRIPDNLRERKEFTRITRPDQYLSSSGTEDTSESSEAGEASRIEDSGTTLRRCEGDTRGRENEAGPPGIREDEENLGPRAEFPKNFS